MVFSFAFAVDYGNASGKKRYCYEKQKEEGGEEGQLQTKQVEKVCKYSCKSQQCAVAHSSLAQSSYVVLFHTYLYIFPRRY